MRIRNAGAVLLSLLLLAGCAATEVRPPPPQVSVSPPLPRKRPVVPPGEPAYERSFPEFVAVVAREGDTYASLAARYLGDAGLDWFVAEFNGLPAVSPGARLLVPLVFYDPIGVTPVAYQTVPILCYHKFSRNGSDKMTVTAEAFEAQMRFLKVNGYRVITLDRLYDFLDGKTQIPKKSVVVTIDDGWRSTYEIAYPILKRYGYPATLFVYTDFVGGGASALTWDMIRELDRNGVDIQCHTKTHRSLSKMERRERFHDYFESLKRELTESARILKKHLNKEVRYLAYPYGDTNKLVSALTAKVGYRGAMTVERTGNPFFAPTYRVGRSIIYGSYDLQDFEHNLAVASNKALQ